MATDDLASLFAQEPSAAMRYGQGQIISWNSETFENVILWNGQPLENLAVVGTTDALSYQPGQYVALHGMDSSGQKAATQWWIAGRILIPGTDNAAAVIDFLRGSLAREISTEVFADRVKSATDPNLATRSAVTFGDPDVTGAPGPTIADVDIVTGAAIVMISADVKFSTEDAANNLVASAGYLSYQISGATSVSPDTASRSASAWMHKYGVVNTQGINGNTTLTKILVQQGLNPGLHTFTMKYTRIDGATEAFSCDDRTMVVIAL